MEIKTDKELESVSNSSIINVKSYEEIEQHFISEYNIRLEGFERKDLLKLKILFSGFDDALSEFRSNGIRKIVYNPHLKDYGKIDSNGFCQIGPKGLGSYGTGIHESIHALDFEMSDIGTNSFADRILETAIKELKLRKNSRKLFNLAYDIVGDIDEARASYELLAYSIETELGNGESNILSKKIYEVLRRLYK